MKEPISCLLIDDDADDRYFFNMALNSLSKKIKAYYSPSALDAIDKLKSGEFKPDFIFLDLNMMPIDGLECLRRIKQISKVVDVPVIIYSTSIDEKMKYETLEAGAFDHFEKPSTLGELKNYLKRVLQIQE
jgi:CheY-like chemotaxis protein